MDVHRVVEALKYLEAKWGSSPSVEDIAEQADCSTGTAYRFLKQAVGEGLIVQVNKKFMTKSVAEAYKKGK